MKEALFLISIIWLAGCGSSLEIETPRKEVVSEIDSTLNHQESSQVFPSRIELPITEIARVRYGDGGDAYARRDWRYNTRSSEIFLMIQDNGDRHIHTDMVLRSQDAFTIYGITEIELRLGGINTVGNKTINAQPEGSSFLRVVFRPIENYPGSATVTQYVPADLTFSRPANDESHLRVQVQFDLGIPLPSNTSPGSAELDLNLFFD